MFVFKKFLGDLGGLRILLRADRESREKRGKEQEKETTGEGHGRIPEERGRVEKL